jgi:hypothetical protein
MAVEAVVREHRTDVAVELDGIGREGRGHQERQESQARLTHGKG